MTDPVIIERKELTDIVQNAVIRANRQLLRELGKRVDDTEPWITQHQACLLLGRGGRGRLNRAMGKGMVKFHKRDPDKKLGRVMVCYEDVEKLINNPKI